MTVILGDSLVKDVKVWNLSDENNKVVKKHFSGANTYEMKSYIQPAISNNPEYLLLHCSTNGLRQNITQPVFTYSKLTIETLE